MNANVLEHLKRHAESEALKALTVGGTSGLGSDGQNIIREDLERVSRNALWGGKAHQALRRVPEFKAENYKLHEFAVVRGYGSLHDSVVIGEYGRARRDQMRVERKGISLATLALENSASFQANLSNTGENLGKSKIYDSNMVALTRNLTAQRNILFWHSDSRVSHGTGIEFKGVFEQHEEELADSNLYPNNPLYMPEEFCVDMRGAPMTRAALEDASAAIQDIAWGSPSDFACHPRVMRGFKAEIQDGYNVERVMVQSEDGKPVRTGIPIRGIFTLTGPIDFYQDLFVGRDFRFSNPVTQNPRWVPYDTAPAAPAAPSVSANAGVAGSLFQAADVAGGIEIKYKLQPIGTDGLMGSASAASANSVAIAGCSVTVSWTSSASVKVYRVLRNGVDTNGDYYEVGRVKNTGGTLTFTDKNHIVPGTDQAAVYEMGLPRAMVDGSLIQNSGDETDNVLSWAYLGGQGAQQTVELARLGLYHSELLYMMGAPMLTQPKRMVRFINIGKRAA